MTDIIADLRSVPIRSPDDRQALAEQLQRLQHGSKTFFDDHRQLFQQRIHNGFIREFTY